MVYAWADRRTNIRDSLSHRLLLHLTWKNLSLPTVHWSCNNSDIHINKYNSCFLQYQITYLYNLKKLLFTRNSHYHIDDQGNRIVNNLLNNQLFCCSDLCTFSSSPSSFTYTHLLFLSLYIIYIHMWCVLYLFCSP